MTLIIMELSRGDQVIATVLLVIFAVVGFLIGRNSK